MFDRRSVGSAARRGWRVAACVFAILSVASAGRATVFQAGEWAVDVTVTSDQPAIMVGEPTWLSFTVTNLSREPLQILVGGDTRNPIGRPASFTVRAVGADGKWVPQPDSGGVTGVASGGLVAPADLPANGSYAFRLFVPHWATFREAGSYTVVCRRTLRLLRPSSDGAFTKQPITEVLAEVRTTLRVLPRDNRRMEILIDDLGERMLEAGGDKPGDEAMIALSWINDPRIVPHFRRALAIRSYALRFVAVQVFGRFATEEALGGLQTALAFGEADFDAATPQKAGDLAARIRAVAVDALSRSGNPKARGLVVAQRKDPAERVRVAVVRAAARLPAADATPLLEELTHDASANVREQAQRALAALPDEAVPLASKK